MDYAKDRTLSLQILTVVSVILFAVSNILNFTYPGADDALGEVQRLFYIHLGSFFGAFVMFGAALLGGIQYLRTRENKWDTLGLAGVEIGLALSSITILTGAIWARPAWGTFWTWDPRLTTIAIMWLVYAAYLFLRASIMDPDQRMRFAAVYAIFAFGSVILTIIIIRVRPDVIHPVVAGPTTNSDSALGEFNLTDRIRNTVLFSTFVYIWISITLSWHRIRLENRQNNIAARKLQLLENL